MHHPNESDLALYAAGDLSRLERLRVDWHVRRCGVCQQEVTEFSSLRAEMVRTAPEPQVNWDRLAAEMKANIRLGLEAGECVGAPPIPRRMPVQWAWAAVATAMIAILAVGGEMWIQHGWPPAPMASATTAKTASIDDVVFEATEKGIQMRDGSSVMSELQSNNRGEVVYGANSRGIGASYVDRETGMVTTNNIYYGQ